MGARAAAVGDRLPSSWRAIIVPAVTNTRSFDLDLPLPEGFVGERLERSWLAIDRSERAALLAGGLEALVSGQEFASIGEATPFGGRGALRRILLPSGAALVRQYFHGGLLRAITGARFCDVRRPFRELALTAEVLSTGISTAQPLGAVAVGQWPAYQLFFVSREIQGQDLAVFLRDRHDESKRREALACAGRAIRRFHDRGFFHRDLHPKNLFLSEGGSEIFVLDLDGSSRLDSLSRSQRIANLARLYRYGLRGAALRGELAWTAQECLALLEAYEPGGGKPLWNQIQKVASRGGFLHRLGWAAEKIGP